MIKTAIYGIGRWGSTLVEAVQGKSEKIVFVTGITRSAHERRDDARKFGISLTEDFGEVLADPAIDAIVLATPPMLHMEHVKAAAAAGKHVFVEKPLTLTKGSAEAAVRACADAGVTLAVGFNRRFLPSFIDMKRVIEYGRIGNILHIECQFSGPTGYRLPAESWRATRAANPAGGMVARGIHCVDLMINLCGEIESVFAMSERREIPAAVDDTTSMLVRFRDGATGYLATIIATGSFWRIQVIGSKGWVEMHGENSLTISDLDDIVDARTYEAIDTERKELEAFADAVDGGEPFPVSPHEAVHGIAALEAISRSAMSGDRVSVL